MLYLTYDNKKDKLVTYIMYLLYFVCCIILFYRQSIEWGGKYYSDLPLHIEFGLTGKDNYSIIYFLYKIFYQICNSTWIIVLFLALVTVVTVRMTYYTFDYFFKTQNLKCSSLSLNILAFISTFTMSIRIPDIYPYSYYGTLSGQAWHNSTYLIMRLVGIGVLLLYFNMEKTYLTQNVRKGQAIAFIFSLIVINAIKPNFILLFAPYMALKLLIDLIKFKKDIKIKFKRIVMFGSCVLPSVVILLIQNQILYGQDTGNGIAIEIGYTMRKIGNPVMMVILGLSFPLLVLVVNYKELIYDKIYGSIWAMWLIAFLEYFLFVETGARKNHGNFSWGMMFATYMLFIASIYKFFCNYEILKSRKGSSLKSKMYIVLAFGLLFCHFISGIYYFIHLLLGGTYGI